jgi:EAL domain-containing protein (putative c-di-GMP-specific phosphodiesterase class I)
VVEKYQIPLELIEAEITETMAVEELQYRQIQRTIQVMHERGVRLSIDDFGSGYSSLGVLEQIPASVIKLDRSFLLNKEDRERQINIMKSIVKLADKLGAEIVCEGIETEDDVSLMYEIGAYVAQGYRYGHPMPEGEFLKRLK